MDHVLRPITMVDSIVRCYDDDEHDDNDDDDEDESEKKHNICVY